jgi:hypothetical protein
MAKKKKNQHSHPRMNQQEYEVKYGPPPVIAHHGKSEFEGASPLPGWGVGPGRHSANVWIGATGNQQGYMAYYSVYNRKPPIYLSPNKTSIPLSTSKTAPPTSKGAPPPVKQINYYPDPLPGYVPPKDTKAPKPKGGQGNLYTPGMKHLSGPRPSGSKPSDRAKVIEQAMGAHRNPGGRTAELGLATTAETKRRSLYTPINPGEALPTLNQVRMNDLLSDSQGHREEQKKLYPITHPTARQADHSAREETFLGDMVMGRMLKEARINSLLEKTKAGDLANEMSLNNLIEKSMSERSKIEKLLRGSGDYKERTAELLNSTPKPKKKKKKKK